MKKIGILGGLGPESTIEYYRIITSFYKEKDTEHNYPIVIIYSVNLQELNILLVNEKLKEYTNRILEGIKSLEKAGADFAIIAANTPHIVFEDIKKRPPLLLLSIVEETAKSVNNSRLKK